MPPVEAHLQMIQGVISRLASQSTMAKGWSITLSGALLGYGVTSRAPALALIAAYATLAFAALDAYYLALERGYRSLYRRVAAGTASSWDMTIDQPGPRGLLAAAYSLPSLLLYGASLALAFVLGVYLLVK